MNRLFARIFPPRRTGREAAPRRDVRLRAAMDGSPSGFAVCSVDGQWIWFNKTCCAMLGYSHPELARLSLRDITHPDDARREVKLLRELLQGDIPRYRIRKRVMTRRGGYRTVIVATALARVEEGDPWLLVHTIETPAGDADTAHDADRLSTLVLNQLPRVAVIRTDARGVITGWNVGAAQVFGFKAEQVTGRDRSLLYRDEDVAVHKPDEHLRIAREEGTFEADCWRVRHDGTPLWVTSLVTRYAPDGTTLGFVEVILPATERETIDKSAELTRLREAAENERRNAARVTAAAHRLKSAVEQHRRELKIVIAALRKEQDRRKELEARVRSMEADAAAAVVRVPIRASVDEMPPAIAVPAEPPPVTEAAAVLPENETVPWQKLEDATLLGILSELERGEATGLLAVSDGQRQRGFFLSHGRIVSCATDDESSALGRRLVKRRWLTEAQRRKAMDASTATGLPFGRVLVILGLAGEDRVAEALREKISEEVRDVMSWTECYWAFVEQEPPAKLVAVDVSSSDYGDEEPVHAAEPEPEPEPYVVSRNGGKYHRPTCISIARVATAARVQLSGAGEAALRGFSACRRCIA